jgi:hypothetical protein
MDNEIKRGVECRCSYSGCDYPITVILKGKSIPVKAVITEWRSPTAKHHLVSLTNGLLLETTYSLIYLTFQVKMV